MPPKLLPLLALALAGCQSAPRAALSLPAAAAGAAAAREATHGHPYWTAAGGLAGYLLADTALSLQEKGRRQELALAFDRGRSQSAQQAYDAIQRVQQTDRPRLAAASAASASYRELPVVVPLRSINGVLLNPAVEYLRVSVP